MMVQSMVIFWGYAFMNGGNTLPLIPAGIFIVSINTGAYMSEIVRGGIISVEKGQMEGAYSVGMTHAQAMLHVVIPQAMRNILPSVSNEFVINIKDTSVLNVIGVMELYYMAGVITRMEAGSLSWPRTSEEAADLTEEQFRYLMMGLNPLNPKVREVTPQKPT